MINHKYIYMEKLLIILSIIAISCSNPEGQQETSGHEHHDMGKPEHAPSMQLNNGAKWKTDEATRKNVKVLIEILNDSNNSHLNSRTELVQKMQAGIDSLVRQCRMSGPDHDALHVWLNQVQQDLKKIKEYKDDNYKTLYATLKKDVERFSLFFE